MLRMLKVEYREFKSWMCLRPQLTLVKLINLNGDILPDFLKKNKKIGKQYKLIKLESKHVIK